MADVILEITVPDAWTVKVLNSFTTITDIDIRIEARGFSSNPEDEFNGSWDFRIDPKDVTETNQEFGERVLRELGKAIVNMVDKAEDEQRYRTEIAAIEPPASDVPSDILQ